MKIHNSQLRSQISKDNQDTYHIVHVISELVRAGAELFVARLSKSQRKKDTRVTIITLGSIETYIKEELINNDIDFIELNKNNYYSIGLALELRRTVINLSPDILHTHLFHSQYLVAILSKTIKSVPVFVTTEHSTHNNRRGLLFFKYTDRLVYSCYRSVFCVSSATKKKLLDWQPFLADRTIIIENGIDLEAISIAQPIDIKDTFGIGGPMALCVGRLFPVKGQDFAIRALPHIKNLSLMLIGDGPELERLTALAKAKGVNERVFFLGVREDVYSFMKTCDIYIQPSRWEGFGLAALEAIACGAQVICSDVSGMKELLIPLGARVVSVEDEIALAECLMNQINSKLKHKPVKIDQSFSIKNVADNYLIEYRQLLNYIHRI